MGAELHGSHQAPSKRYKYKVLARAGTLYLNAHQTVEYRHHLPVHSMKETL